MYEDIAGATQDIAYAYDGLGRLTASDHAENDSRDRAFTYDVVGNRLTQTEGAGPSSTTTYAYNPLDQLESETVLSTTTEYTYDANGNLATKKVGTDPAYWVD